MVGVLLAAGLSRRFGSTDKLLHPLPDGTPMALSAARNLAKAIPLSIAVVRPDADLLREILEEAGMQVVSCSKDIAAMSNSFAVGVEFSKNFAEAEEGFVIALADMPFIKPDTIAQVANKIREGSSLVVPTFRGQRGHPVGFSYEFRQDLENLYGDMGARPILQRNPDKIHFLETTDRGILIDIDNPDDMQAWGSGG